MTFLSTIRLICNLTLSAIMVRQTKELSIHLTLHDFSRVNLQTIPTYVTDYYLEHDFGGKSIQNN